MQLDIVTLFPAMFKGPFDESMIKKAVDKELVKINIVDLRDYAEDKHRQVDDYPYGGGKGMVLKPEPIFKCIEDLVSNFHGSSRVILLTPQGEVLTQGKVMDLSTCEHLVLLCGHYEGVDERVRECLVDEELSIGDYVLTGGELPAMVVADAVVRLLPGLLDEEAINEESFTDGMLEYPQYTRPADFRGYQVPEVLLSGNHALIKQWRKEQSEKRTARRRPDLYNQKLREE